MRGKSPEGIPFASACGPCAGDCSRCPLVNSSVTPGLLDSKQSLREKPVFSKSDSFRWLYNGNPTSRPIFGPIEKAVCPKCGRSFQSSLHSFCAECRGKAA